MSVIRIILGCLLRPRIALAAYLIALSGAVYDYTVVDRGEWGVFPWWVYYIPLLIGGIWCWWQLERENISNLDRKILYGCCYLFVVIFGGGALGVID